MDSKTEKRLKAIASRVCAGCATSPFAKDCPRKDWFEGERYPLKKYGDGTECPVLRFAAKKLSKKPMFFETTEDDTWLMCENCPHAKVDDDEIDLTDCFEKKCMDCPIQSIREQIQEYACEATCC